MGGPPGRRELPRFGIRTVSLPWPGLQPPSPDPEPVDLTPGFATPGRGSQQMPGRAISIVFRPKSRMESGHV